MIRNPKLMKWMNLRPRTVIHVGSHFGQDEDQYRKLNVQKVFWCEADPNCVATLKRERTESEVIEGLFWSESNLHLDFWMMKDSAQNSAFEPVNTEDARQKIRMKTTTLDDAFTSHKLELPVMLVLDVQGAELEVLKGAGTLLSIIDFIVCEITIQSSISKFSVPRQPIEMYLKKYKFFPSIKRNSYNNEYYDLLFVKKSRASRNTIILIDFLFSMMKKIYRSTVNEKTFI